MIGLPKMNATLRHPGSSGDAAIAFTAKLYISVESS